MKIKVLATGSTGNAYTLEENGQIVLLDAGIKLLDIKRGVDFRVSDIIFAFVSHVHRDHCRSADNLRNMGIPIFEPYKSDRESVVFIRSGWYMKSFRLEHDGVSNCGVYIMSPNGEKIVYASDFAYITYRFDKLRINHFIIECNHMDDLDESRNDGKYAHVLRGHSSLSTVKDFLKINKTKHLKTVILCHLSADNSKPGEMQKQVQEIVGDETSVYVAKAGLEVIT